MSHRRRFLLASTTALSFSFACRSLVSATPTPPQFPATPYAEQPAAGICGEALGDEVLMTLEPGIPDPRCIVVTGGQHLRVSNRTGGEVEVAIGPFTARLAPGEDFAFPDPFGSYLLPGAHLLAVTPCCGGELWYKPTSQ